MRLTGEPVQHLRERGGVSWIEVPLGQSRAIFSTRIGGRSAQPRDTLNLALHQEPDPSIALWNRGAFAEATGLALGSCVLCRQVHGTDVIVVTESDAGAGVWDDDSRLGSADALVRPATGPTLIVQVADCAPVVVADPTTGAGACIHAGWRGAAAGVIGEAVRVLCAVADLAPSALVAAVGPCARNGYQVGFEVWEAFAPFGDGVDRFFSGPPGRRQLDLGGAVAHALRAAGIRPDAIIDTDACTLSRPNLFFSHRRDGPETGRMWGCLL